MYRQALRSTPRAASALRQTVVRSAPRRFASTSPADKPRTWKGAALRWGLAGAALYYYNTSSVFADEASPRTVPEPPHFADSDLKTVDAVIEEKRQKSPIKAEEPAPVPTPEASEAAPETTAETTPEGEAPQYEPGSPEALEAEAGQQGAFNPETGEINWDCPCLGGMADGPCGEEFKTAFSCFVYSTEEPKGIECIEKFQGMQECFRKYPEIYGAELADDEEAEGAAENAPTESSPSVNSDGDSVAAPEKVTPRAASKEEPFEEAAEKPAEKKTETKPETTTTTDAAPKADKVILETVTEAAPAEAPKKFSDATDANKTAPQPSRLLPPPIKRPFVYLHALRGIPRPSFLTHRIPSHTLFIVRMSESWADVAAKGPKQTAEEAAAPQPPQVVTDATTSTSSLVDVDSGSVRTVPSDYLDQEIQTETQAARVDREEQARAEADLAKKKAAAKARRADSWLTSKFAALSDNAAGALAVANLAGVVALSGFLGYRAWGLYERGRLSWQSVGLGLGILGAVGIGETVLGGYLYKTKGKK